MEKLLVQSGVYESLLTNDIVVVAPSSSPFFTVDWMWLLVIILLVAGGPTLTVDESSVGNCTGQ